MICLGGLGFVSGISAELQDFPSRRELELSSKNLKTPKLSPAKKNKDVSNTPQGGKVDPTPLKRKAVDLPSPPSRRPMIFNRAAHNRTSSFNTDDGDVSSVEIINQESGPESSPGVAAVVPPSSGVLTRSKSNRVAPASSPLMSRALKTPSAARISYLTPSKMPTSLRSSMTPSSQHRCHQFDGVLIPWPVNRARWSDIGILERFRSDLALFVDRIEARLDVLRPPVELTVYDEETDFWDKEAT
ncbi:uncharacterized protein ACLA_077460 [Aspergillus clavatus NRRL 1]|uniref:Uncharacterized protein n=1 Tax=Aspergillus clavatus (strain ATCC 1007 / CBS 513.65 / DSM 816 / NCTC 3887 / NRRL 1 / QM 1276 / 107) TaxID=344612 RepID=A1CLM0_ASPCL|nr:uncharacterized protein ACLA_077460 [Aspergillus clavatus NRRL 1]EAW08999.1 hypothetical protein ACLA_077460 [Aspergillus clavatus NRRL 1]